MTRQQELQKEAKLAEKEAESRWGEEVKEQCGPSETPSGVFCCSPQTGSQRKRPRSDRKWHLLHSEPRTFSQGPLGSDVLVGKRRHTHARKTERDKV